MLPLLICAVKSVLTVLIAASAGTFLVRLKILDNDSIRTITKVVFFVTLPALLITKVATAIDLNTLKELWIFPVSAAVVIFTGFTLGRIANNLLGIKGDVRGLVIAASGLGNSGFLPIPLIVAICGIFPVFLKDPESSAKGITFISAYVAIFSPLLWINGYNLLAGRESHHFKLKYFFPPPVIGIIIGITIGLISPLKEAFCSPEGILFPLFAAGQVIAAATIPLALIVLGGSFAERATGQIENKSIVSIIVIKQIFLPLLALGYVASLRYFNIISADPLIALVLIIEAAVPPATNLIIISSIHGKNEKETAKALFWSYILSVVTLTFFITFGMQLFS